MKNFRVYLLCLLFIFISLSSCNSRNAKKLGPNLLGDSRVSVDSTDKFVFQFAIRDTLNGGATNRSVVIQGRSTHQSNLFVNICANDASACNCSFFTSTATSTPITATTKSVNQELNIFSCDIPASVADADLSSVAFVRITNTAGTVNSGQMRISEQATLAEVLGDLSQDDVRKIFGYTCTRTFLEGSGISGTSLSCPDGMVLSTLRADYGYYIFSQVSGSSSNFDQRGSDTFYNSNGTGLLCGQQILRVSCSSTNTLKFGLTATSNSVFKIAISLTPGPDKSQTFVGYAASADSNLNCPPGLVKIRPFQAMPSTYTGGNSNFVNSDGKLNDNRIEVSSTTITDFSLRRQAGVGVCASGICPIPSGGITIVQTASYTSLNPIICAIPENLLSGI